MRALRDKGILNSILPVHHDIDIPLIRKEGSNNTYCDFRVRRTVALLPEMKKSTTSSSEAIQSHIANDFSYIMLLTDRLRSLVLKSIIGQIAVSYMLLVKLIDHYIYIPYLGVVFQYRY